MGILNPEARRSFQMRLGRHPSREEHGGLAKRGPVSCQPLFALFALVLLVG